MEKKVLRHKAPLTKTVMPGIPAGPLCAVYSSWSPVEAHLVRGMLEDAGIRCVLSNEFIAAVDTPVSNITGGVQVLVRESDAARAGAILRETV